jgi:hypothetical protein
MKEDYILALKSGDVLLQNVGAPPASKEDRYKLVTHIERILFPTGEINPEIKEIRELYIARGLSALDAFTQNSFF